MFGSLLVTLFGWVVETERGEPQPEEVDHQKQVTAGILFSIHSYSSQPFPTLIGMVFSPMSPHCDGLTVLQ